MVCCVRCAQGNTQTPTVASVYRSSLHGGVDGYQFLDFVIFSFRFSMLTAFYNLLTVAGCLKENLYYCGYEGPKDYKPVESEGYKLAAIQVVFRHGARTSLSDKECFGSVAEYKCPVQTLFGLNVHPSHTMQKIYLGGCEKGQLLTEIAYGQFQRVAVWLQEAYQQFFPDPLTLRSSDMQRTMGSMFLLRNFLNSTQALITTEDLENDALAMNRKCARVDELESKFTSSQAFQTWQNDQALKICAEKWKSHFGTEFSGVGMDCLLSAHCAGVSIPGFELAEDLFQCTVNLQMKFRQIKFGWEISDWKNNGLEICRLSVRPVLKEIHMKLAGGKSGLIASHDSTIACLLQAVGDFWDGVWPKYAETLVFEKYEKEGEDFFRIVRDGQILTNQMIPLDELLSCENI